MQKNNAATRLIRSDGINYVSSSYRNCYYEKDPDAPDCPPDDLVPGFCTILYFKKSQMKMGIF
jgi:hypothetical protein